MPVVGGVVRDHASVELSLIAGGKSYTRIYNDIVATAIDKFVLISKTISKLATSTAPPGDVAFYIEQAKQLLHRAHVELIPGDRVFQNKYNMWLLDGYIRMLLETVDLKLIAQLLDLDSIIYSLEDAERADMGSNPYIDFDIAETAAAKPSDAIALPQADTLHGYLLSFDHNLVMLADFILANKNALEEIYTIIIGTVAERLRKK